LQAGWEVERGKKGQSDSDQQSPPRKWTFVWGGERRREKVCSICFKLYC
jgi:hypothetical protein